MQGSTKYKMSLLHRLLKMLTCGSGLTSVVELYTWPNAIVYEKTLGVTKIVTMSSVVLIRVRKCEVKSSADHHAKSNELVKTEAADPADASKGSFEPTISTTSE